MCGPFHLGCLPNSRSDPRFQMDMTQTELNMKRLLITGLLALPAAAATAASIVGTPALELERELNDLRVDVDVTDLDTNSAGIDSGQVQVLITNHERFKVACQLHPGATEASPGLDESPITIIAPEGRRALSISGEYGDSTLNALLTCIRDE